MTNPMNDKWDQALQEVRRMSDMFKGLVSTLVDEGWTEEQARSLIVAMFVAQSRGAK